MSLKLNPKNVITISKDEVFSPKDIKAKLAPIFNSIAEKNDIPIFVNEDGDDEEIFDFYDEENEWEY